MPSEYLCNLIVPGAAKSGTSSFHEYLNEHPEISMSSSKEPHHFARNDIYAQGANAHNKLFEQTQGVRYFGESSTGYLPWADAAARVASDLDDPKVIILLRHPVDRCFSHYRWRYRLGLEKRGFLQALKEDGVGYNPEKPTQFGYMAYLEFSQYERQYAIWKDAVGEENCLVISSEDLLNDRSHVMEQCFSFLNVSKFTLSEEHQKKNETNKIGRISPEMATKAMRFVPKGLKSSWLYKKIRRSLLSSTAPTPPKSMTQEERAFVQRALADDIRWFESRFGQSSSVSKKAK
jgi:hypothetical protein